MAATYEIHDGETAFVVVSRRSNSLARNAIWVVFIAIFFLVAYRSSHNLIWLGFGVLAMGWQIVEMFRDTEVVLRITNLELTSEGYFGGGYRPDRSIARADVIRFEYREERGGGDAAYSPSGLYVQRKWGSSCVLPDLNEAQTDAVMDAIYKRFPDMPLTQDQPVPSIFGDDIIRLGLSEPRR